MSWSLRDQIILGPGLPFDSAGKFPQAARRSGEEVLSQKRQKNLVKSMHLFDVPEMSSSL